MSTINEKDNKQGGHSKMIQIVVFRLGQEEYALQIDQIKEVVKTPGITPMPQSPKYIKGVANIRGNIIAIVDLAERFGLVSSSVEHEESGKGNYTLVLESEEFKMGILVRDVPNTLAIAEQAIDQSVTGADEHSYIKGIVKLDKRLIILIDIFRVIGQKDAAQSSLKSVPALA